MCFCCVGDFFVVLVFFCVFVWGFCSAGVFVVLAFMTPYIILTVLPPLGSPRLHSLQTPPCPHIAVRKLMWGCPVPFFLFVWASLGSYKNWDQFHLKHLVHTAKSALGQHVIVTATVVATAQRSTFRHVVLVYCGKVIS